MTSIRIIYHLPFVAVTVRANGKSLVLDRVLLDTGSAGTVFRTEDLERIGVLLQPRDRIIRMQGVGGTELVAQKQIELVEVGDLIASPMTIQLGALEYDIPMDGILGFDFLLQTHAIIDFETMEIRKG